VNSSKLFAGILQGNPFQDCWGCKGSFRLRYLSLLLSFFFPFCPLPYKKRYKRLNMTICLTMSEALIANDTRAV